ncbi:hypothetical protein PCE1_002212 [Barthelona sp. PCE]
MNSSALLDGEYSTKKDKRFNVFFKVSIITLIVVVLILQVLVLRKPIPVPAPERPIPMSDKYGLTNIVAMEQLPHFDKYNENFDVRDLKGKTIALLAGHAAENAEVRVPLKFGRDSGANLIVTAPGWIEQVIISDWVVPDQLLTPDMSCKAVLKMVEDDKIDAVLVPGGRTDALRTNPDCIAVVKKQYEMGKLVSTQCAGAGILIDAEVRQDIRMTGSPVIKKELSMYFDTYVDCLHDETIPCHENGIITDEKVPNIIFSTDPHFQYLRHWMNAVADYITK